MRTLGILAAAAAAASLAAAAPALAATAHNSQAGSWGPTTHTCEATPYFQDGGCLTSYITGQDDGQVLPREGRYRERRPLRSLDQ